MLGSLEHRLKRLMLLRVVIVTTLLLIAIYVESVSETLLPVNPLYVLIVCTYVLTLLYAGLLRVVRSYHVQAYLQISLDYLVVTGLVYLTGPSGGRAGFMLLYPICALAAAVLLPRNGALLLAGMAVSVYAAMLGAVRAEVLPPYGQSDILVMSMRQLLYALFVTGFACATVTLIGSYLAESLRHTGARLEQAVEQVADLQELHRLVVDNIPSGLILAGGAGQVRYINRFGAAMLGLTGEEAQRSTLKGIFESKVLDPALLDARRPEDLRRLELVYARGGERQLDLGLSVSPVDHPLSGGKGYLLIFQDVTRIKHLEKEVRLKERLAAVGEMAAQLAHEIRNPLGSISGSAQVLMSESNMSDEQNRLLGIIVRESKRLSDTLNQFLFQARPAQRMRAAIDVGDVVAEAVTLLRNAAEVGSRHRIEFTREGGPHVCRADRDQVTQVFWNLARNGLAAMPEGGTLRIAVSRDAANASVSFRDEGPGFSGAGWPGGARSEGSIGTGLGLAIVYRIVRDHWGDVTIRDLPGKGTEVEVRFPLLLGEAASA